jgi:molybdopterin synthase catalytic subunit
MKEPTAHSTKSIFVQGAIPGEKIMHWLTQHQKKKDSGAHDLFLGQVRADLVEGKTVSYIEYTAYENMADQVYQTILQDTLKKYEVNCIHTLHSLGKVESGQWSLAVLVSASHRDACFAACKEMVDRIKSELPVWGKEVFEDHTTLWKKPASPTSAYHE